MKLGELESEMLARRGSGQQPPKRSRASAETIRDFDGSEGTELSEPFETTPSPAHTTRMRVWTEGGRELTKNAQNPQNPQDSPISEEIHKVGAEPVVEPFFERFDFEREPPADINLASGYDPYDLAGKLWKLVAQDNHPARLFLADGGQPVRLEIVDGEPRLSDLTTNRLAQEVHRVAKFGVKGHDRFRQEPCPRQLVAEMLARPINDIPLPRLRQLATAPMIGDESGRIVFENGYHRDIGTFLYSPTPIQSVSSAPTPDEVQRALAIL